MSVEQGILKFDMDDKFGKEAFMRAVKAGDLALAISDIGEYLRGVERYQDPPDDIERIREKFYEILDDNNINLEEILS